MNRPQTWCYAALAFAALLCAALTLGAEQAKAGSFVNPIADAFDPHIVTHDGYYYLTGTSYSTGIYIQKSPTLAGLRSAPRTYVYYFSSSGYEFAESPFITFLQGKWYIYAGGIHGPTGNYGIYVLESSSTDPLGPYTFKATLKSAPVAYTLIGPGVLEMPNGDLYLTSTTFGFFIHPLSNPWTISGPMVVIRDGYNDKTYDWEGGTWEISTPIVRTVGGQTTVTLPYSTENHVIPKSDGPDGWSWAIGAMVNTNGNILDPASWQKLPAPLMHGGPDSGLYRVLAANHFKSPDGTEDWIVFNAGDNLTNAFSYRHTFAKKITWNADGTPNFGEAPNLLTALETPSGESGSPPPLTPGTILLSDDFSSGSGNWTVVNGNWSVTGGKFQASDTSENIALAGEAYWANYSIEAQATAATSPNNSDVDLLARVQDSNHFYQFALYKNPSGGREWLINKNVGGTYVNLANGTLNWNLNQTYWLKFDVTGQTLTALYSTDGVNWDMLGSVNDDTYTFGKVGLRMWGGVTGHYDNVVVKANRASWGGFYGGPDMEGFAIAAGSDTAIGRFVAGRDADGHLQLAIGGSLDSTTASIDLTGVVDPAPEAVYQRQVWAENRMYYDFPSLEPNKNYLVRLHFAEIHYNAAGQRSFHVELNGKRVLTNYDVLADAGAANKAVVKEFVTTSDAFGHIQVAFLSGTIADGNPIVNGLEVLPIDVVFADDFDDGDLSGWTSASGTWTNPGGVAQGTASGDGFLMRTDTGANFTYEARIRLMTANAAGALVFRSNADGTESYAVNFDSSGQFAKGFEFPYVLHATHNLTLTTGVWYHLKVVANGNTMTVYVNNKATAVMSFSDSSYTSGRFGINVWNGTAQFDDVIAYTR
jgi:GH43 family beta-xylosidase